MNPCRCGHALDAGFTCHRQQNARCVAQYQTRLSGPLLDRIDLTIEVPAVSAADLLLPPAAEGSAEVARRVAAARQIQTRRYAALGLPGVGSNAAAPGHVIEDVARPAEEALALLRDASERMNLSARGFHRVLKLARTIADLDGSDTVARLHIAEALSYRIDTTRQSRAA
jgi:magnesium chelatase family protein